jgi:ABC-type cobalamin/Fe3+-siderophores transport system ATPase subunit
MQQGRFLAEGSAEDVITAANLREAYGIDIDVCYVHQAGRRVCIPKSDSEAPSLLPSQE